MPMTPHSNDPRDNAGEFALGKDGKPLVDRYGRPVHRRAEPSASRRDETRAPQYETRYETRYEPAREPQYEPRRAPQYAPAREVRDAREVRNEVPMQVSRARRRGEGRPKVRRQAKRPGCGAIIALLLAIVLALVLLTDARLTRVDALPDEQIPGTAGTNWLFVGSDSRTGLSEKEVERLGTGGDLGTTRTDTIMVLHLPLRGKPTLVSIPRDSYVPVPGYGYDKINAAFSIGGPQLLVETVEHNTGLHVDRYAEIGMGGLAGVVDAAGGVEICVAEPIDDPLANINLQPGCQQMDGPTALGYVRTRATAQGDLDRVARQREFMTTLVTRVLSPSVYLNPFRMARLLWVTPSLLTVNSDDHAWNLARIVIALRGGLETETVPIGGFTDTEVGNVVLWDDTAAEALFASLR